MNYLQHVAVVIMISALAGCTDDNDSDQDNLPLTEDPLAQNVSPADMQGLWQSDGYMTLLEITDDNVLTYELSSVHCILIDNTELADYVEDTPHFLSNDQRMRFATDPALDRDEIHPYFYNLVDQLPASCVSGITEETDNPVDNFTVFWNVFNEQYAFFELRDINWQEQYDDNIAAAEGAADDEELFSILASMIEAFGNDSHVDLEAGGAANVGAGTQSDLLLRIIEQFEETFTERQLQDEFNNQTDIADFDDFIDEQFFLFYSERLQDSSDIIAGYMVNDELKSAGNEQIVWGLIEGNVGYLGIGSMIEFIDIDEAVDAIENGTLDEADAIEQIFTALNDALDQVMADLSDTDAMIIDIRTNGGGFDSLGLEIAGRFFDQRRLVFRKKARKGDDFSEEVEIYQGPTVENPYTKPVYLLTSGETASAAEIFTLSMRTLPYVTLVGETTEGVLSDVLESTLPNDWTLGLANEVYTTADDEVFESVGIVPTVTALFLDPDFEANQQDAALEAALQDL